jgi:cytochrome c556
MRLLLIAAVTAALTTTALAAGTSVKDDMKQVVDPATNTIFAVGGDVDPANGPGAAKAPAARWAEALAAAQKLKASAAILTGPQKQAGAEWTKSAADFTRLAADAEKAAIKKDGAAFSKAANDLGDTCTACHSKYKKQSGD